MWLNSKNTKKELIKWVKRKNLFELASQEVKNILWDPICTTAIWMWLTQLVAIWYNDINSTLLKSSIQDKKLYIDNIINSEQKELSWKIKKTIYNESYKFFKWVDLNWRKFNEEECRSLARWLIEEIDKSWLLDWQLPKIKPAWISSLFALIYIYLYTKTILNIRKKHHTVATFSFAWFSILNWWFSLQNWILDPGSLGYLSAWIMWAVTVVVNEIEKKKIARWEVKPWVPEYLEKDLFIQEILKEFVIWDKNPVVIYLEDENWKFPEEMPLFWNPAMEKITWYKFDEIKHLTQKEILKLLYWYDEEEYQRAISYLGEVNKTWVWYKDVIFTLKAKNWQLVKIAWHTEKVIKDWRNWSIRFWSADQAEIYRILRNDSKFDCLNAKSLEEDFESIIKRHATTKDIKDENKVISVISTDFDHFKYINDTYWHLFWDIVISDFIDFVKQELRRKDDNIYKVWWDEFIILCTFINKYWISEKIKNLANDYSRFTIKVVFDNWNYRIDRWKKHPWWYLAAKASYMTYKTSNQEELKKFLNKKWKWEIILPPISLSCWISDFYYSESTVDKENWIDFKSELQRVKAESDAAQVQSKKNWKNKVTIFELEN